jgi:hypothetical protein
MSKTMKLSRLFLILAAAGAALGTATAQANEFTYDQKANEQIARKLKIPVFFTVPASARATLPRDINTSDRLLDFKHPDARDADGNVGLRLMVTKRAGLSKRLGQSGLVQTGDLLLSFRSEWGGAGPYPNIQMGISHVGMVYVTSGYAHNIDNPLSEEFLGPRMRADLTGGHYNSINLIHIVRPRGLSEKERDNLHEWASLLVEKAKRIYPSRLGFNQDYNAPKYKPGKSLEFVKKIGQLALGIETEGPVNLYCSEFAWSLLALKNCDPDTADEPFSRSGVPSCVKPAMQPMQATGDFPSRPGNHSYSGLAEGPLMVIDAMKLPEAERKKHVRTVFVTNPSGMAKLSTGHRTVAQQMKPKFAPLEIYYNSPTSKEARAISTQFNKEVPDNYSPTSYLINTLLPSGNSSRTMDYVATIVIE